MKGILLLAGTLVSVTATLMVERGLAELGSSDDSVTRIGIIGCHKQNRPTPSLEAYLDAKPEVVLWVGDNVYVDTEDDIGVIERGYAQLAARPAFQALKAQAVFVPIWDDHDFGRNNAGREYQLREQSKEVFRRFWGLENQIPRDRAGVYHARYFGQGERRLQVVMLDGRYNREKPGPFSDTLGEEQWRWLQAELRKPARLRLIVSGYQVLLDANDTFETWSNFPSAQARLFSVIRRAQAKGVLFVAGDQHYGEVGRWPGALGYDAIELVFSGINQEEEHILNTRRVSPVAHARNSCAYLDIQWERSATGQPHLVFTVLDGDSGATELAYRINLGELQ